MSVYVPFVPTNFNYPTYLLIFTLPYPHLPLPTYYPLPTTYLPTLLCYIPPQVKKHIKTSPSSEPHHLNP